VHINFGDVEIRDSRDSFINMIQSKLGGCGPSQHLFGNVRVTMNDSMNDSSKGDRASCAFYGRVMHAGVGEQKEILFDFWGEYQGELIRTDEGWRFASFFQRPFNFTGDFSILKPAQAKR